MSVARETTTTPNRTTTTNRDDLIRMFVDGTAGEAYANGRLKTIAEDGLVKIVSYHERTLAALNPETGNMFLFAGHEGGCSSTVSGYLSRIQDIAEERSSIAVRMSELSPERRQRPVTDSAKFIGRYHSFSSDMSPVERWAKNQVNAALEALL